MPSVTFAHDFSWVVPERKGQVTIDYKAGNTYSKVRTGCLAAAKAAGCVVDKAMLNLGSADEAR